MWVYGLDWAGPGQRQVADACECGNEPSGSVKCGEFLTSCKPVSCSRRTLHRGLSEYGAQVCGRFLFLAPGKRHRLDACPYGFISWNPLVKKPGYAPCPFCGGRKETLCLCREKNACRPAQGYSLLCHKQYTQSIYSFRRHYKYRFFASSYRSVESVNCFMLPFLLI